MSNINEFKYYNDTLRITTRVDPARGGKRVETRVAYSKATILERNSLRTERITEVWCDIGTIMSPITNHVPEQPKSLAYKLLVKREARKLADRIDANLLEKMGEPTLRAATDFAVDTAGNCEDVQHG